MSVSPRLLFLDNLRWTVIVLVISMHAADTYSPLGNWYFVDRKPLSTGSLLFFAAWQTYLQSFFMGLLFFIAGFFVPSSLDRKGPARFLHDRAVRLGVPVLFYTFVLGPVTEYFVARSWSSTGPTSFGEEWWKHICNGQFLSENGPLWFCLALLLFSTIYTAFSRSEESEGEAPSIGEILAFGLAMALLTFLIRAVRPPSVLNLPLRDFAQYILLFGAGIAARRRKWLLKLRYATGLRLIGAALSLGLPAWFALIVTGGALRGEADAFSGGWHWQAAAFALLESLTCVCLCYGMLTLFCAKFNRQGTAARFLSGNAFSVYVFHPPILIAVARVLHGQVVQPVVGFVLLTFIAVIASFFLSATVFRNIPLLKQVL